ncbi:transcriptional regulator, TetR family [Chitinophaga terrae (ex Kim and Jung 2007)]|uniref:Transcriptional regulator, TetR family n=1 Tax=Chitinophaga terrae (ex Kim and Jung 2007) TaxID=408074 RepID=A0A1H4G410_9BACT|nr:TetR/AcrR family transcriptional regulator [Chitinophaga terrae (ex Kim and Jung 2007)]MDQ0109872.1 TetR/AcrR family transcriptional repressor of mexJK operon [Chitinophaga terrae (ex Kim and Jung 2007)]GEP92966.1 TetR family transcriptional regulator [Chitinophaga terrae (ex Kim and Jung 2007)]SEB04274.1 transcriptional regulator, TetR family [Chitinophaga terrae (ex Kim and Jung 2007)]
MHTESKDEMRDKILEAALRRFTHYGASKTTMNEIADDLRCSKASLYYYFPDKKAMHMAVLEKIAEAYFQEMEKEADNVNSATEALIRIVDIRKQFISKFCRLEIFMLLKDASDLMLQEKKKGMEREIALHVKIIKAGIASGEFNVKNPEQIAELLVQACAGLRFSVPDHIREDMDLDDEMFELVMEKQKQLLEVFINGIKA